MPSSTIQKPRINTLIEENHFDHEAGEFYCALSFISPSKGSEFISTIITYKDDQRDKALKKLIAELDRKNISHNLIV